MQGKDCTTICVVGKFVISLRRIGFFQSEIIFRISMQFMYKCIPSLKVSFPIKCLKKENNIYQLNQLVIFCLSLFM